MRKVKQILRQIKIEEYVSIFFSLILLFFLFGRFYSYFDIKTAIRDILYYIILGGPFFAAFFVFIYGYFYFKVYLFLGNLANDFFVKKKKIIINFKQIFLNTVKALCSLIRDLFFIFFPIGLSVSLLRVGVVYLKPRLVDDFLMGVDKFLTGVYPFIWLQNEIPHFIKYFLTPMNIFSFHFLSVVIGLVALALYISKKRDLFSSFLLCLFLSLFIALPLWFKFPALSPNNMYINNVYKRAIPSDILENINSYEPDKMTVNFLEGMHEAQKDSPPISTMPSMHVIWAIFLVYFAWRIKKWTLVMLSPWLVFNFLSTIYLAQHYFIDILVAIPLALILILISEQIVKLEHSYRQNDDRIDFRAILRQDLEMTLKFLRPRFQKFKNKIPIEAIKKF